MITIAILIIAISFMCSIANKRKNKIQNKYSGTRNGFLAISNNLPYLLNKLKK